MKVGEEKKKKQNIILLTTNSFVSDEVLEEVQGLTQVLSVRRIEL